MYYWTPDGRQILDGIAGLWCVNAGHCRPKIVEAIQKQAAEHGLRAAFQHGPPEGLRARASGWSRSRPPGLDQVFFTNSGSEAVDTALKMAIAYHRARGEGARTRLIGRERGYHGVGFGGISVGGIVANRKMFGTLLAGVDHLPPHPRPGEERVLARRSPSTAPSSPTTSSASSRCTTRRPSPP